MITAARQCGCPEPLPQRATYPSSSLQRSHPHDKIEKYAGLPGVSSNVGVAERLARLSSTASGRNECVPFCPASQTPVNRGLSAKQQGEKIVSEIAKKGLPYKEIEAIINDNRVVIRLQKGERGEEYGSTDFFDPPCHCATNPSKSNTRTAEKQNVPLLDSTNDFTRRKQSDGSFKGADSCRTMTVFPRTETLITNKENVAKSTASKKDCQNTEKSQLEDNPNVFLLRIRRTSDNGDKKENIDLEFRTPRPWSKKGYAQFSNMQKGVYSDPRQSGQRYSKCSIADNSCPHRR